ncbi:unnamed protein product, partial [Adineta steineri]
IRVDNGFIKYQNQSQLAQRLTQIARDVDLRVINGKIWSEKYIITRQDLIRSYWYKYRSIRVLDTIDLIIESVENLTMCIVVSGTTFGGGTYTVIGELAKQRFPEDKLPQAFSKPISLNAGISLRITKNRSQYEYTIYLGNSTIFAQNSTTAGQLLILAVETNSEFSTICLDTTV